MQNATLNCCSCLIQHGLASGLPGQEVFRDNAGGRPAQLNLTRYRLFPARLGSISYKPLEGEISSDGGAEPPQTEGTKHDGIQNRQSVRQ
jgi:hypothetical protein